MGQAAAIFSSVAIALAAAGCASTRLDAQWADPQLAAHPLRGAKVLVACEAYEAVVQQICRDRLAEEVVARGATPVFGATPPPSAPGRSVPDEQYLPAAKAAGARAVLATTITLADTAGGGGSGVSIGIGGFGGFGGSTRGGVGVGVSVPVGGGAAPSKGYSASSRVTDAASGRLLFSAKATAPPSGNVDGQMAELAKAVVGAADKAGLF